MYDFRDEQNSWPFGGGSAVIIHRDGALAVHSQGLVAFQGLLELEGTATFGSEVLFSQGFAVSTVVSLRCEVRLQCRLLVLLLQQQRL